jgi:hypothetical protein
VPQRRVARPAVVEGHAIKTYRYLRLAMVLMVVALGSAVVLEVGRSDCIHGSISA